MIPFLQFLFFTAGATLLGNHFGWQVGLGVWLIVASAIQTPMSE